MPGEFPTSSACGRPLVILKRTSDGSESFIAETINKVFDLRLCSPGREQGPVDLQNRNCHPAIDSQGSFCARTGPAALNSLRVSSAVSWRM